MPFSSLVDLQIIHAITWTSHRSRTVATAAYARWTASVIRSVIVRRAGGTMTRNARRRLTFVRCTRRA
jgi:hypothetical protein